MKNTNLRILQVLTTIASIVTSIATYAAKDEIGETPTHWYRFVGVDPRDYGEKPLTWNAKPTVFVDTQMEGTKCAIAPDEGHGGSGSGISFGSADWTVVVKGRMDSTPGTILLCLGNPMGNGSKDSSVSLTYEGEGKVCLSLCSNGNAGPRNTANKYDVSDATEVFHVYALQYMKTGNTISLWVDGVKKGEFVRDMSAKNYSTFTFFGTPTKNVGISTFTAGQKTMTSAVSDFRVYQRLLTADELKTLTFPSTDEIGCRPAIWYSFNGSLNLECASFVPFISSYLELTGNIETFCEGRNGIKKSAISAKDGYLVGKGAPWGGPDAATGGDWSVVLDIKGENRDGAVYFATGTGVESSCFALVSAGENKVKVVKYSGHADYASAFTVDVPNASTDFHQYAIVRTGSNIKLYVDGELMGEMERSNNPGENGYTLLKSPGGDGKNALYDAKESVIDDFRIYKRALTGEELNTIRLASRDELGGTPVNWYKFDNSLESSGRAKLNFGGSFADASFDMIDSDGALNASGDKPYGTDLSLRAGNWTCLIKAKSVDIDNAVIASFGSSDSTEVRSIALASAGAGCVSLSGFGEGLVHSDLLIAEVPDASSQFHVYAIVRNGTELSLWVDAICVGAVERTEDPTFNGFAFFTVYNGVGNSGFIEPMSGGAISDFRVYDRALSAKEQLDISGNRTIPISAEWTNDSGDGKISNPQNWDCVNGIGEHISDVLPCGITEVRFVGPLSVQIPVGEKLEYESIVFDNCSLSSDCDLSGLKMNELSANIDLAGHTLLVSDLLGGGVVTDTKGGGVLRLNVAEGAEVKGDGMSMSGKLKFVKDGLGVYTAIKSQSYSGGTDIAAGTARFGSAGDVLPFGASGSLITVASGAEIDANGKLNQYVYSVRLDGGTLSNRGNDISMDKDVFGNVSLTEDSTVSCIGSLSLRANKASAITLDLNGKTLTVNVPGGKVFRLYNCDVTEGKVNIVTKGGTGLSTLTVSNGVRAKDVDFDIGGTLAPYSDFEVRNLTLRSDCYYQDITPGVGKVFGTLTLYTKQFQNIEMQDGSMLSLVNHTGVFSSVNSAHDNRKVMFANGASVSVDVSKRTDVDTTMDTDTFCVMTWPVKPNTKFSLDGESAKKYSPFTDENGLYLKKKRFMVIIR